VFVKAVIENKELQKTNNRVNLQIMTENIDNSDKTSVLTNYLPFIMSMTKKVKGTPVEKKWNMMSDLIINPKINLTIDKLKTLERMLEEMKKREDIKDAQPHITPKEGHNSAEKNDMDQLVERLVANHNKKEKVINGKTTQESIQLSYCELKDHSYARSAKSLKSDLEVWSESNASSQGDSEEYEEGNLVIDQSALSAAETSFTKPRQQDAALAKTTKSTKGATQAIKDIKKPKENEVSRTVRSVRSELIRLSTSSSAEPSLGRRAAFVKRLSIGYKDFESSANAAIKRKRVSSDYKVRL
jgi:hypothetical protein